MQIVDSKTASVATPSAPAARQQQNDSFNIMDIVSVCVRNWYWFLISLAVCLGIGLYYVLTTPPVYTRSAAILLKDSKSSGGGYGGSEADAFQDMGLFNTSTNLTNEISAIEAPDLMAEVVRRLHLDVSYTAPGQFHPVTLYGLTQPVAVDFIDLDPSGTASFDLKIKDGKYTLDDFRLNNEKIEHAPVAAAINDTVATPVGRLVIAPHQGFRDGLDVDMTVKKSPVSAVRPAFSAGLTVAHLNEKSSIINLSYRDVSTQRADDILNYVINIYNENWVKDKNQIAVSTSMFINDRLGVIESELGNVDSDISDYKSEHLIPDVGAVASMYMSQAQEAQAGIKDLNNQLYMARYIRNYLSNAANSNQALPVSSGVQSLNVSSEISAYNTALAERNSLVAASSEANPLVQEMDRNLAGLRSALLSSIDNQILALNAQIHTLQSSSGQATAQIASNPKQAKYLLSVERQQKVKESLYLYLLQKREENELSQAFTAYNTRVIRTPDGSSAPTAPARTMILLVAAVIGIAIPLVIIVLKEMLNTVVRGRKDIENLAAPFVGEIPQTGKKNSGKTFRRPGNKGECKDADPLIVVKPHSRDIINEAFRVVRTNLEFMTPETGHASVIAVTSANPGSGKTFVAYNLALSLGIKEKRVLVIDLDLRRGSLSHYAQAAAGSKTPGIASYLAGRTANVGDIIIRGNAESPLDIIPIGTIPPNPTELLFNGRLESLITSLRDQYDYIFLDCPPIEIVADAAIINRVADTTLFVIRAGLFQRSMLPEIDRLYNDRRYRNISIILNGTDSTSSRYGSRYGYHYGYSYGSRASQYYTSES